MAITTPPSLLMASLFSSSFKGAGVLHRPHACSGSMPLDFVSMENGNVRRACSWSPSTGREGHGRLSSLKAMDAVKAGNCFQWQLAVVVRGFEVCPLNPTWMCIGLPNAQSRHAMSCSSPARVERTWPQRPSLQSVEFHPFEPHQAVQQAVTSAKSSRIIGVRLGILAWRAWADFMLLRLECLFRCGVDALRQ